MFGKRRALRSTSWLLAILGYCDGGGSTLFATHWSIATRSARIDQVYGFGFGRFVVTVRTGGKAAGPCWPPAKKYILVPAGRGASFLPSGLVWMTDAERPQSS